MKFSKEEINEIVDLKGADGTQIDIFDLHGVLFVGNSDVTWDITKTYTRMSEHSLGIPVEDFEGCETEDDVEEQFAKSLRQAVLEKLV